MAVARRVYLYGIAFVALGMLVAGLQGLAEVGLEAVAEGLLGPFRTFGDAARPSRVSYAGALAGIGLIAWLIHWVLAERPVGRGDDAERQSSIRKLFLYAVLFMGGLVMMANARELIADVLEAAFGQLRRSDLIGGSIVPPLATLLVAGPFWAYYARVAARDRAVQPEVGAGATLRRWYAYGLALVGLLVLLFGAVHLLTLLWEAAAQPPGEPVASGNWLATAVTGRVASIVVGLGVWYLAWTRSTARFRVDAGPDPERDSILRKVFLYLVLLIAVTRTVWSLAQVLYVLLRSMLIPGEAADLLGSVRDELGSVAAYALVFGLAWLYHARVVEREAAATPERGRQAGIRRLYGYLVAFVGAMTMSAGLAGTLATILDLVAGPGTIRPDTWWAERLSLFATLIAVGLPVWYLSWSRLQREAASPDARHSLARRIYLFLAFGISVLALLGSGAYALYQVFRVLLGEAWSGSQTSELIDAASASAVAAMQLAYHLRVFRADAAEAPTAASDVVSLPSVSVLIVRAADPEALSALERELGDRTGAGLAVKRVDLAAKAADRMLGTSGPDIASV